MNKYLKDDENASLDLKSEIIRTKIIKGEFETTDSNYDI